MDDQEMRIEMRLVLERLKELTLAELNRIELYWMRRVKLVVAAREAFEGLNAVPPLPPALYVPPVQWTAELEAEAVRQGMSTAGQVDGLLFPETDEDGDEVLEATPLEDVVPFVRPEVES